jgi:septum formation protein
LELLRHVGYVPNEIVSPDVDEIPLKKEKPELYAERIARIKAEKVLEKHKDCNILAVKSIVVVRRKIVQNPKNVEVYKRFANFCSGRSVLYISFIYFIKKDGSVSKKLVRTKAKFKYFSERDIVDYTNFVDNANVNGYCECFVKNINGSYSGILGLPLYETRNILISAGI